MSCRRGLAVEPLKLASPWLSANHVLVWPEEDGVCVQDLGSRNGSLLRLSQLDRYTVHSSQPPMLQLAPSLSATPEDGPGEARWTGPEDFAPSVANAVRVWLRKQNIPAEVTWSSEAGEAVPFGSIHLDDDRYLNVNWRGATVDLRSERAFAQLVQYVKRQKTLFEAEDQIRATGLVLESPAIHDAHRKVVEAAENGRHVLLMGPTGSGKEGLAYAYHRNSGRGGELVIVNCGQLSREFLQAELFGAEIGAYTGCNRLVIGKVEQADNGTLFLDELGEIPRDIQAMLLRFLDRGEYERMGGYGKRRRADVRVVSATNRDLRAAVKNGEFRKDLWFRLAQTVVDVPPLCERPEDVISFLKKRRRGRLSAYEILSDEALDLLRGYPWEGNFRELLNFVEMLPTTAGRAAIDAATCRHLLSQVALDPRAIVPALGTSGAAAPPGPQDIDWIETMRMALDLFVRERSLQPRLWKGEVLALTEQYLKPLLFAHLTGAVGRVQWKNYRTLASSLAALVQADRGTALKQLVRYLNLVSPRKEDEGEIEGDEGEE